MNDRLTRHHRDEGMITAELLAAWRDIQSLPELPKGGEAEPMDTLGTLIDKLITVDLKMWHNQEILYAIRRMTEEEFVAKYANDLPSLHAIVKRCCDLNVQRSKLMDAIDVFFADAPGKERSDLVKPQSKTY